MIRKITFTTLCFLLIASCTPKKVQVCINKKYSSIQNEQVRIEFDMSSGLYKALDLANNTVALDSARFLVNNCSSGESGMTYTASSHDIQDDLGQGKMLKITAKGNTMELQLQISLYNDQNFIVLNSGVQNNGSSPIRVNSLRPLADARVFPGSDKSGFRILDGNAGGEATKVYDALPVYCRNNILFTSGTDGKPKSIVSGGLTYHEYEKFTELKTPDSRRNRLAKAYPETQPVAYLNLPVMREEGTSPVFSLAYGYAFEFPQAPWYEMQKGVYNSQEVILSLWKPEKDQLYSVGLGICSDNGDRSQSVWADNGPGTTAVRLCESFNIPDFHNGSPVQVLLNIPQQLTTSGDVRILIRKEGKSNVVLNEAWLCKGHFSPEHTGKATPIAQPAEDVNRVMLNLYAQDPVGKLVDSGTLYMPNDKFYIDFCTANPYENLEKYSAKLKTAQQVKINYYDFPSVCLWYAMHPYYGEGPGMNNSAGAVGEMDQIVSSGFLKYATAAVRLVPDCYEKNNEQGWWDDKHFQMHGSGNAVPGEVTVDRHYKEPYETTAKWAQAVREKGGIPLLYVQTGKRSQDYAETYPEHMLFNQADAYIPDFCWTMTAKAGYDFTDPGFLQHMKEVYDNFRNGGLQGMMFDYTNTGWAGFGGMEDKYSTTSAAYRKIFELAYNGLGSESYIHERCLERGTDLTLGTVSSQRIWGDTDDVTPEMVSRGGARWYKNRVVVSYDMDAKNLLKAKPADNPDGRRKLLTMCYVTSGRLLLANSFARFDSAIIRDLGRVYPFHTEARSARPVDLFTERFPHIYDFKVNDQWHQVTLYNTDNENPCTIDIDLHKNIGGLGLESGKSYYVYDFWNDRLIGKTEGSTLQQTLRPGEARMLSVREVISEPQVISCNRHIMQGAVELKNVAFSGNTLSGKAEVIGNEDFEIVLGLNGREITTVESDSGSIEAIPCEEGTAKIRLRHSANKEVSWKVIFK